MTNKWGEKKYYSNFEIFVHNFQTAGENKEPGQDTNSIVADPTKFNATEIKNDPTAAKEYSATKQAAEKALKDAQTAVATAQSNLDAANQYKKQLPAAEKALADATNKLTAAEKSLRDAEANLNSLNNGSTNKADELSKAKAVLATAKQEADKAKAALADAQGKLSKAEKDVKDAAALVMTKVANKEQAEELVRSLENAKQNYAKAKAEKEAINTRLKELETYLTTKRAELAKLEKEYKELLKQYISNLTRPENPELIFSEDVKEEDIEFNVVEELDPSLKEGERVVKTKGVTGRKSVKTVTFKSVNKMLDTVTVVDTVKEETILTPAVDEIVAVGPKAQEQSQSGVPKQPKAPVQNKAKLKALPNTGQGENGVASVAALAALAIAARLRKAKN